MKCDRISELIEDYQYGELGDVEAAGVAAHLQNCPACRRRFVLLGREAGIYESYAAAVERDLEGFSQTTVPAGPQAAPGGDGRKAWARRLAELLPASSWARQAIAAMLLVAVTVAGTLMVVEHYRSQEVRMAQQTASQPGNSEEKSLADALQSIQRAEQEYLKAIGQLSTLVEKQRPGLDPRIYAELQINLRLVDDHIAATRNAYYAHPQDAELALYMLAAYSRKVALLQDMTS